jgi:hypothetical protein
MTKAMRDALTGAINAGFLSCWDYGSSTISALKKRGFIEPDQRTPGFKGTYYRITDAGRAAHAGASGAP